MLKNFENLKNNKNLARNLKIGFSKKSGRFCLIVGLVLGMIIALLALARSGNNSNAGGLLTFEEFHDLKSSAKTAYGAINAAEDVRDFLINKGFEVAETASSIKDVVIPKSFNAVYENYNALQKSQGYDLSEYKGVTVKSYSFIVLNYDYNGEVFANVLVYDGEIIGGDVCSYAVNGFMVGFADS